MNNIGAVTVFIGFLALAITFPWVGVPLGIGIGVLCAKS